MRVSELTDLQRNHMIWRLDHNTGCGLLTAIHVCSKINETNVKEVFLTYGGCSPRSAAILSGKVERFMENVY